MCVLDIVNLVLVGWLVRNEVKKQRKRNRYKKYIDME
jgi:hypothetical protein